MNEEKPPQDYAEILGKGFATKKEAGKPRWKMSARNRRKLERIRQRVRQLRGQS